MSEKLLFKNILNPNLVEVMGRNVLSVSKEFDKKGFIAFANDGLDVLELKDRARHISFALHKAFSENYIVAIGALIESMSIPLTKTDKIGKYQSFYFMPFSEYIIRFGVDYFDQSMKANYELTKVYTAEFSIRPFLIHYTEKTLSLLNHWALDKNHHVRRLVSEGTRTRLPWAGRLPQFQKDPSSVLRLLEKLKNDPELYVRRSVANNLNDIAKDHPTRVIETLWRWQSAEDRDANTDWIIKHASRTLIKDGYTEALQLLGFDPEAQIRLKNLRISDTVIFGEKLNLSFDLENEGNVSHKLVIDFVVYFKKANGNLAPKVFKMRELELSAGQMVKLTKAHPIKPITTRTYYFGKQEVAIQVNGKELAKKAFVLRRE